MKRTIKIVLALLVFGALMFTIGHFVGHSNSTETVSASLGDTIEMPKDPIMGGEIERNPSDEQNDPYPYAFTVAGPVNVGISPSEVIDLENYEGYSCYYLLIFKHQPGGPILRNENLDDHFDELVFDLDTP